MERMEDWDAAVDKLRAALVRAIERRGTEEHPKALRHFETAREELDRITRHALGEQDADDD